MENKLQAGWGNTSLWQRKDDQENTIRNVWVLCDAGQFLIISLSHVVSFLIAVISRESYILSLKYLLINASNYMVHHVPSPWNRTSFTSALEVMLMRLVPMVPTHKEHCQLTWESFQGLPTGNSPTFPTFPPLNQWIIWPMSSVRTPVFLHPNLSLWVPSESVSLKVIHPGPWTPSIAFIICTIYRSCHP